MNINVKVSTNKMNRVEVVNMSCVGTVEETQYGRVAVALRSNKNTTMVDKIVILNPSSLELSGLY